MICETCKHNFYGECDLMHYLRQNNGQCDNYKSQDQGQERKDEDYHAK